MLNLQLMSIVLIISSIYCKAKVPTTTMVAEAKEAIFNLIIENPVGNELPMIAGFVRLAFHDCVGPGHCDGCLDHTKPANYGLLQYTTPLDDLYDLFASQMSRADFYILASMTGLEMATNNVRDKFTGMADFKIGRTDCSTSPKENSKGDFPLATFNMEENVRYFGREFGFSAREVVALMGVHTLGRASVENSGYEGPWLSYPGGASNLDNKYYKQIIERKSVTVFDNKWHQVPIKFKDVIQFQWQLLGTTPNSAVNRHKPGQQSSMFLNCDIALAYDFKATSDGKVNCDLCENINGKGCCEPSSTHSVVIEFSADNANWLKEFTAVYLKMIEMGDSKLQPPVDNNVSPTQKPRTSSGKNHVVNKVITVGRNGRN